MTGAAVTILEGPIHLWPIEHLRPHPRNPRTHSEEQVAEIAASILALGFNDPIAVTEDGVIVEGHGRLLAAQLLQMERVPVIILPTMTPAQESAYRIAHNKLAMHAGWDEKALREELAVIYAGELDATVTGFTEQELDDIIGGGDEEGDPDKPRGLGTPQITYTLVFDDEDQQNDWFQFIRWLKRKHPDDTLTVAGRISLHLAGNLELAHEAGDDDDDAA